jgi:tetratricopeptide (TPR) repeat protein
MGTNILEELRERARETLAKVGTCDDDALAAAKSLVKQLCEVREYEAMGRLAEAVSRRDPNDARNRRLYGQYLIDTGKVTAAIDLLEALVARLPATHPEHAEATGLLGRAYKQIFFDACDKTSQGAREALERAIQIYRRPYEQNPANTWHGVNLVALLSRARDLELPVAPALDPRAIAQRLVATLEGTPEPQREHDPWYLPTLAEASLGLGDWDVVERHLKAYVAAPGVKAFHVASTLRQFTQVWDVAARDERGRRLVDILRARLLELPGGAVELGPAELQRLRQEPRPSRAELEAILGTNGPQTYAWWREGLKRASAVGAVRQRLGTRVGTAFLVRAGDLGRSPGDELLALTNFHVVNEHGASPGIRPEDAEVVFEAIDPNRAYAVAGILKSSPPDLHDASLLRLKTPVTGIDPLPLAANIPVLEDTARVYVIGHPGGRELQFSFQDNELIDHEGPPAGKPQIPGVVRLHYRAPTEGGSSGSPVFNQHSWEVVALHHMGGKGSMPRLNGKPGTYAANEGVSIRSIVDLVRD